MPDIVTSTPVPKVNFRGGLTSLPVPLRGNYTRPAIVTSCRQLLMGCWRFG
ncbi:MAG: hypothetical protein VKJ09_09005 [Leptolyngbya sp.]|nr:hypothetical protein [Leptolyngbya sp.]